MYCPFCGNKITKTQDHKNLEQESAITHAPIKCDCKASGFINYMIIENTKYVLTLQMIKR